jgi:uncharacterized protein (DUF4415 family)
MVQRKTPELIDDDNPEWTDEDFVRARPAREVLPEILGAERAAELLKHKPGQRGRQKAPTKRSVTLRIDSDVLAYFKAQGPRWQTRINEALKKVMATDKELSDGR